MSLRPPNKQTTDEKAHHNINTCRRPIVTLFCIPSKKIYLCFHSSIHFNQALRFLCKHKHTEQLTQISPFVPNSENNVNLNLFYIYCCLSGLNLYHQTYTHIAAFCCVTYYVGTVGRIYNFHPTNSLSVSDRHT